MSHDGINGGCVLCNNQVADEVHCTPCALDVVALFALFCCLQVHGHDFSCLATIASPVSSSSSSSSSNSSTAAAAAAAVSPSLLYISGSEEKVLRVFEAPQAFTDTLTAVRNSQSAEASAAVAAALADAAAAEAARAQAAEGRGSSSSTASRGHARALGASVAALGLSNKAVYVDDTGGTEDDKGSKDAAKGSGFGPEAYMEGPDFVPCAAPSVVHDPPYEEHLAQNTLWPEIRKLYGHGNDVFCVCSSPSGRLLASACKAQSAGAAAVWVWEVGSWKPISQLSGHTLTVTQLEFSHDGRYLLSGSRDRSFSLWKVPEELQQQQLDKSSSAAPGSQAESSGAVEVATAAAAAAAGGGGFELVVRQKSAHSRIIWGVSWSHDCR
jgi:elongator complex protein 2